MVKKSIGFMRGLGGVQTMNEKMPTLQAANGTSGNNKPCVAVGVDMYNQSITGDVAKTLNSIKSDSDHTPCVVTFEPGIASRDGGHVYENVSGTLGAMPGDNQMTVVLENHPNDSRVKIDDSGTVQTLTSRCGTGGGNVPMVMQKVICLQGNGIDRADTAGCNGKGWTEDVSYTLNTIDRPAVAYCIGNGQVHDAVQMEKEICKTLNCMDDPMKVMIRK